MSGDKPKVVTLLGIRPDYIRMFKVIELFDATDAFEHVLVHSGQHYDDELYGTFLKQCGVRQPDIDLGVGKTLQQQGKNNHALQLSLLSERVFDMIEEVQPDVIVYLGDTNTILSSVVVARSGVPVVHIEAGGRSYDWRMPEEKNRVIIDHLSDAMYSYLPRYKNILVAEGIPEFRVESVGNLIHDSVELLAPHIEKSDILGKLDEQSQNYILVTLHREENVSNKEILERKLRELVRFAQEKDLPIVFPVMPRVRGLLEKYELDSILEDDHVIRTEPLGFFEFAKLEKEARLIVSDSGTVQEEALILGVPCVIARRSTERPETIWAGATILEGFEGEETLYEAMQEAFDMDTSWDRTVLNPEGGSPSERLAADFIEKMQAGFFDKSRQYEHMKNSPFVRQAYGKEKPSK
ncbi:UDP-N-acetylglucosamine 2-epimerase (non-hydrolyzing) [bacterium]|nr:UDP-N-acetylglucosamine 2-epimerase (non-hydrolyzing) [bacterium]|tara:strand:+ start:1530 stop:2756 length:1227 start_codon:yes stop_codon:yes gene_type:complete